MSSNHTVDFSARRERFRQYEDAEAVRAYLQRLETQWPERATVVQHIVDQITALHQSQVHVLELCCGPGRLAATLLNAAPNIYYTGIDISQPFLIYAQQALAQHTNRVQLLEADLSGQTWPQVLQQQGVNGQFNAIVSLQSLHDVGDKTAVSRVYSVAKTLLLPQSFFLNADLIVAQGEALPDNPGRLTISCHLELMKQHSYDWVMCSLAINRFGCVIGWQSS